MYNQFNTIAEAIFVEDWPEEFALNRCVVHVYQHQLGRTEMQYNFADNSACLYKDGKVMSWWMLK